MKKAPLSDKLLLQIHDLMLRSRLVEERLIQIYKQGQGYFWIGGPGEEAFGVPLGLLVKKGQGLNYDYLHLHYRSTPTLMALGMNPQDAFRLMMNKKTDPFTGGRNFSGHYCMPKWNVTPVTSPIELQYSVAIGTAHAQRRSKASGITVVSGGDAGTAEGDFASCLVWASRKGEELPMLITVQNNSWGISTPYETQHPDEPIASRAESFGISSKIVNGNDPIECYINIKESLDYIRKNKKPVFLEFKLSRLYGHSSADGASYKNEECCLKTFEEKLLKWKILKENDIQDKYKKYKKELMEDYQKIANEPRPDKESIWDHVYMKNENADWRKF